MTGTVLIDHQVGCSDLICARRAEAVGDLCRVVQSEETPPAAWDGSGWWGIAQILNQVGGQTDNWGGEVRSGLWAEFGFGGYGALQVGTSGFTAPQMSPNEAARTSVQEPYTGGRCRSGALAWAVTYAPMQMYMALEDHTVLLHCLPPRRNG
jgi:hypothetical protein